MGYGEYVNPLLNDVTYAFQIAATTLAYVFNIILIYIVQRSTNNEIGTYRILITYFALSDLYYNTLHFITYPIPENYGNAFFMRGYGFYRELLGQGLYMGAYGHAFPILIFHFLYRLFAIKYPQYLAYFPLFLSALVLATAANDGVWFSVFYWFFHPDEEILAALTPIYNGSIPLLVSHTMETAEKHSQALYWTNGTFNGPRWRNLFGVALISVNMISAYAIIIYCSYRINKYLKERSKSEKSIRLHNQLFRSLVYQSFVPLFTAYYPAASTVLMPAFGLPNIYCSLIVPPACVTHALFDPILLIFTISDYRKAFLDLTGLSKWTKTVKHQTPTVSSNNAFTRISAPLSGDLITF